MQLNNDQFMFIMVTHDNTSSVIDNIIIRIIYIMVSEHRHKCTVIDDPVSGVSSQIRSIES